MTNNNPRFKIFLCGIALAVGCAASYSAPLSACPPVLGEKDTMLSLLQALGANRRMAQICGVQPQAIQRRVQESMAQFKPCLDELGVKNAEIEANIKAGEPAGQEIIDKSGVKKLHCEKIIDEYR